MVILIKRDHSRGRVNAVNLGDLRSQKCCGHRSIEGRREAIDLFHLLPVEMLHRRVEIEKRHFRKEHCNGDPLNPYKLGRQPAFGILERTSKTEDFK